MTDVRIPKLPSLRALTAELRSLHEAWSHPDAGGEYATLRRWYDPDILGHRWEVTAVEDGRGGVECGREWVPGPVERECPSCAKYGEHWEGLPCPSCDGTGRVHTPAPFDATAAARRLLAAARDAGFR